MPSTTVHMSEDFLRKLNEAAKEKGISRSSFIVGACERVLEDDAGKWPEGFFSQDYGEKNLRSLRKDVKAMEDAIFSERENRKPVKYSKNVTGS